MSALGPLCAAKRIVTRLSDISDVPDDFGCVAKINIAMMACLQAVNGHATYVPQSTRVTRS
jgi:hypothetical protein